MKRLRLSLKVTESQEGSFINRQRLLGPVHLKVAKPQATFYLTCPPRIKAYAWLEDPT